MSSTDEMKTVLGHVRAKIEASLAYELSVSAGWRHHQTIVTLAYAQGVLDLLVAYLQSGDEPGEPVTQQVTDAGDYGYGDLPVVLTDAELDAEAGEES